MTDFNYGSCNKSNIKCNATLGCLDKNGSATCACRREFHATKRINDTNMFECEGKGFSCVVYSVTYTSVQISLHIKLVITASC